MDREKVIGEFERWCDEMEDECPVICLHALALLKEQEPVSPIRMHHTEHKQTDNYRCGKCGDDMYFEQRFCEFCGQAAKWD